MLFICCFNVCVTCRESAMRRGRNSPATTRTDRSTFVKMTSAASPRFSLNPSSNAGVNQPQVSPRQPDADQAVRYFRPPIASCGQSARVYTGCGNHHRTHYRYPSLPSPSLSTVIAPCLTANGLGLPDHHLLGFNSSKTRSYNFLYPS